MLLTASSVIQVFLDTWFQTLVNTAGLPPRPSALWSLAPSSGHTSVVDVPALDAEHSVFSARANPQLSTSLQEDRTMSSQSAERPVSLGRS